MQPPAAVAVERDRIVRNLLAEIALDHVDAVGEKLLMRVAPPHEGPRMGEVDDTALGKRRQHLAERARAGRGVPAEHVGVAVPRRQQIAARGQVREQRRVDRHIGILPHANPQAVLPDRGERGTRIGKAVGVPFEIDARFDFPRGAAVEGQHVAGDAMRAQLRGNVRRFLRRLVIRARNPETEAPQRDRGGPARELRVQVEDAGRRFGGKEEEIERLVLEVDHVRTVRPVRMSDPVRHRRRRVDEQSPRALARVPGLQAKGVFLYASPVLTPSASTTCEWMSCPRLLSGPNFSPRP